MRRSALILGLALASPAFAQDKQELAKKLSNPVGADGPESAPHGWGARLSVTLLFPK